MVGRAFRPQASGVTRIQTDRERAREVAGWQASFKSATVCAAERGYSPQSLRRWAKQQSSAGGSSSTVRFVRLEVATNAASELTVEVRGASGRVTCGFDPKLPRSVVEARSKKGGA